MRSLTGIRSPITAHIASRLHPLLGPEPDALPRRGEAGLVGQLRVGGGVEGLPEAAVEGPVAAPAHEGSPREQVAPALLELAADLPAPDLGARAAARQPAAPADAGPVAVGPVRAEVPPLALGHLPAHGRRGDAEVPGDSGEALALLDPALDARAGVDVQMLV